MVNIEKIRQKIQLLEDNISKLKVLRNYSLNEFSNDFIKQEAAKHLLQVSVECMIDITNHIIARERFKAPTTSADAFNILCNNGILSKDTVDKYRLMAKFRNRIVHIYNEVDINELYTIIQYNLDDFTDFIKEIIKFVKS